MYKVIKIAIISMMFFSLGCNKPKDDELFIQRKNYMGDELRTDGYYYYYYNDGVNPERIVVCFLYRNGVFRAHGSAPSIQDFESRDISNQGASLKDGWGVFIVESSMIKYEIWRGARWLEPRPVIVNEGKILNDTTFQITLSHHQDGSERRERNDTCHFRQFSPKPDSSVANKWIK